MCEPLGMKRNPTRPAEQLIGLLGRCIAKEDRGALEGLLPVTQGVHYSPVRALPVDVHRRHHPVTQRQAVMTCPFLHVQLARLALCRQHIEAPSDEGFDHVVVEGRVALPGAGEIDATRQLCAARAVAEPSA